MKKFLLFLVLLGVFCSVTVAQNHPPKAKVSDKKAKQMLVGQHKLALQWISWDYFGTLKVTDRFGGVLLVDGEQRSRTNKDYVTVAGYIETIDKDSFVLNGSVISSVDSINKGEPCKRTGKLTFRITGKRKYWRLMEMDSPCSGVTDYVDIFFK